MIKTELGFNAETFVLVVDVLILESIEIQKMIFNFREYILKSND